MSSKWDNRYTELVTAVARNMGAFGIDWGGVAAELNDKYDDKITPKAAETAFWRLGNKRDGQPAVDARLLKRKMSTNDTYAKIVQDFPGYTIEELKARMKVLAGESNNRWIEGLRIGFLDVESVGFDSNVDFFLSWALKEKDGPVQSDLIAREECIDYNKLDKRICESLVEATEGFDMLVTWFGTRFDIKAARTRFEWWGLPNPLEFGDRYHWDMYYTAREKLNMHSNRLEAVANFYGAEMEHKAFDIYLWKRARLGDQEALDYVLKHNIEDVMVLEDPLFHKLKRFKKLTRKSV